jgi:hypothetical protein
LQISESEYTKAASEKMVGTNDAPIVAQNVAQNEKTDRMAGSEVQGRVS